MLSWIASFAASCRRRTYRNGLAVLQRAAAIAGASFDRLAQRGVEFELHDDPLLYPAFDAGELDHLREVVATLRAAGSTQRLAELTTDETLDVEPALDPHVVGAVIAHGERRVRPELLTAGLHRMLIESGVEVRERSPVGALVPDGSRWMVDDGVGGDRADAIVLAGGIGTTGLLAGLGMRLPVLAAKGYSRTYRRVSSGATSQAAREGLSTSSRRRSRSASSTIPCESRARSSSAPVAWRFPAGVSPRSLPPPLERCRGGRCRSQPTGPACARSRPTVCRSSARFQIVAAYTSRPRTRRWGSHLLH